MIKSIFVRCWANCISEYLFASSTDDRNYPLINGHIKYFHFLRKARTFGLAHPLNMMKGGFPVSLSLQEQYDKIYKYCCFKVKNTHLAEDLTQETFLRFFDQSSYISRGKPLAYLYTIAKNLCIDAFRKADEQPLPDAIADEGAGLKALETSIALREAVATLPEDIQEILLLRFSNELMVKEICEITGLSRFVVGRKINSGLKKLKTFLREEDFS